jgi:transcription elongation factor Elf1
MEATNPFVHVFLFECGWCGNPIRLAIPDSARNLEVTDAKAFALLCKICGWSGKVVGTEAKRHWVDTWEHWVDIWQPDEEWT